MAVLAASVGVVRRAPPLALPVLAIALIVVAFVARSGGAGVGPLGATSAPVAAPTAPAAAPATIAIPREPPVPFRMHTVKYGEELAQIAADSQVSVATLARNNGLAPDASLRYGDLLAVPFQDGLLYTVFDAGLTPAALAARLGIDAADLASLAVDAWGLVPGRTLLIPLDPERVAGVTATLDPLSRLDAAAAARVASATAPLTLRDGGLSWPAVGTIAQLFWWGHTGVDIAAPGDASIYAPADGVVSFEGWTPFGGIAVCTKHAGDLESCSYHAAATFVSVGDTVHRGEAIAAVGMTGLANGPHVHWEVRRAGVVVDPLLY